MPPCDAAVVADPLGVVLAGGRARRLGGASKACLELAGRPLVGYPLATLTAVCARVAVVCKTSTALPALPPEVERWDEDDAPRHPATGIASALERAAGPVLVLATDMPWIGSGECQRVLDAARAAPQAAVVLAAQDGRLQPAFGLYRPAASARLLAAARGGAALTEAVEALGASACELPARVLRGINTPDELAAAERELAAG